MKLIITNPPTGSCKAIDIEDDKKLRIFYDRRMAQEVAGDELGDEFKGYVFKITGGNDKQGFPMMQGVLVAGRVRLLLKKGHSGFRPRREGERKRKSVRGCIVGPDLSVLDLVIVKKGENELPGITDKYIPRRLGPKRASKIRKLFNLTKEDDVRKYVLTYRRERKPRTLANGKTLKRYKVPKIQRLVTPRRISNKKRMLRQQREARFRTRKEAAAYAELLKKRLAEARAKSHKRGVSRHESIRRDSAKKDAVAASKLAKAAKAEEKGTKVAAKKAAAPAKGKVAAKKAAAPAKGKKAAPAKGSKKAAAPAKGAKKAAAPAKAAAKPAAPAKAAAKPAAAAPAKKAAEKPAPAKPAAKAAAKKPAAKKQKQ